VVFNIFNYLCFCLTAASLTLLDRWYNTTYAFNAITIILYALVSQLHKGDREELLKYVEKCLRIFHAMDSIAVAKRCAELTKEIYDVAKLSLGHQHTYLSGLPKDLLRDDTPKDAKVVYRTTTRTATNMSLPQYTSRVLQANDLPVQDGPIPDQYIASLFDPSIWETLDTNWSSVDLEASPFRNLDDLVFQPGYGAY
jgi:hypothetical protein